MSRLIISADSHMNEPNDFFVTRVPADLKDRVPRLEVKGNLIVTYVDGKEWHRMKFTDEESAEQMFRRGDDPDARLKDLQLDGVSGDVIYPGNAMMVGASQDREVQQVCARIYNNWLAEAFLQHSHVFAPVAILPTIVPDDTIAELEHVAGFGLRAALMPMVPQQQGMHYNSPVWDPVWSIAAEAGIVLSFHVGTGEAPKAMRGLGGAIANYVKVGLAAQDTLVILVAAGVLARYPKLHVVMVEGGGGYLGWICERMDEAYEEHEQWVDPKLEEPPSAYIRRQAHVTFSRDRTAVLSRSVASVDCFMWASDYPHIEGSWPESRKAIEDTFSGTGLGEAEIDAIVGLNAKKLYGIGA